MRKRSTLKEYTITVYYSSSITVKVVAHTDEEAVDAAIDKASDIPMTEADTTYTDYQIEDTQPLNKEDLEGI